MFDPLGLKSSGLFKKLAETNTQNLDDDIFNDVSSTEVKFKANANDESSKRQVSKKENDSDNEDLFGISKSSFNKLPALDKKNSSVSDDPPKNKIAESDNSAKTENDLFEGIQTDRSFSEMSFKNVQKVNILFLIIHVIIFNFFFLT